MLCSTSPLPPQPSVHKIGQLALVPPSGQKHLSGISEISGCWSQSRQCCGRGRKFSCMQTLSDLNFIVVVGTCETNRLDTKRTGTRVPKSQMN